MSKDTKIEETSAKKAEHVQEKAKDTVEPEIKKAESSSKPEVEAEIKEVEKGSEPAKPEQKAEDTAEPEAKEAESGSKPEESKSKAEKLKEKEEQTAAGGFRQKIEKVVRPKEEKKEEPVLETRIYTIPLRDVKKTSRLRRAKRAVAYVKEFMQKHMKTKEVKISPELNKILWARGITHVASKIKVQALKTEKFVTVKPSE